MIDNLQIENFKCLSNENFDLKKLNIITGLNCAGKSSVIQAMLLFADALLEPGEKLKKWKFLTYRNKLQSAENFKITIDGNSCVVDANRFSINKTDDFSFLKNEGFLYLSEDRRGPKNDEKFIETDEIGDRGEYVMSYYFRHKDAPICSDFCVDETTTLTYNVSYWLKKILFFGNDQSAVDIDLFVEEYTEEKVKVSYDFGGLKKISPKNLGAGLSYLAKVIIVCLRANPGQTVIIENPEIHLHPGAQAGVGHFLSFIASKGVQLVIETHCEHLINRVRYEVFLNKLDAEDVKIYYKNDYRTDFLEMGLSESGHYKKNGAKFDFPSGFFDATLEQLIRMG